MGSKTSFDVVNILYSHVKNSILFADMKKASGGLYKFQRPANSIKEDVVINSLSVNREEVQQGIVNVNIHVPNLIISGDSSQPNTKRLDELSDLFQQAFEGEIWEANGQYEFNIQQDILFQDSNNQHYINFRIEFNSINI